MDATHYLRQHKFGITALCTGVLDPIFKIFSPVLVSADDKGTLVIWDLVTRRPILIEKLGDSQIVSVQFDKGKYVSILSKDHKFRMFELYPIKTIAVKRANICGSNNLIDIKQVFEVPVNTLNFANFGLSVLGGDKFQLITSHTQDAHFLDIYQFQIPDLHSLKRFFKRVDFLPLIKERFGTDVLPKIDCLGIIMRILCVDIDTIFCGFESGFIVGLRRYNGKSTIKKQTKIKPVNSETSSSKLSQLLSSGANQIFEDEEEIDEVLEIISVDVGHYPEPVLSMVHDKKTDCILSSSTTNTIIIENEKHYSFKNEERIFRDSDYYIDTANHMIINKHLLLNGHIKKDTTCKNIGFIEVVNDDIILGTWSGKTYKVGLNENNTELAAMKKKSSISVTESPIGNTQANPNEVPRKQTKIGAVTVLGPKELAASKTFVNEQQILSPGQLRRTNDFISSFWFFIGYEDGSISMYKQLKKAINES